MINRSPSRDNVFTSFCIAVGETQRSLGRTTKTVLKKGNIRHHHDEKTNDCYLRFLVSPVLHG